MPSSTSWISWAAVAVALAACGDAAGLGPTPDAPTAPETSDATAGEGPMSFLAVRVDPDTFLESPLGHVTFHRAPPFRATMTDGGPELARIIDSLNQLEFVTSSGLGDEPGTKIPRTSPEFFTIMRGIWLGDAQHVSLRMPATTPRAPQRRQVIARDGNVYTLLGVIEFVDLDYARVVEGPAAERKRLGQLLRAMNDSWWFSVDVAPPAGKHGSWSRGVPRGTAEYRAHQRDKLLDEGFVLLPVGVEPPSHVTPIQRMRRSTVLPWLAIDVANGLEVVPATDDNSLFLSGPPGGPNGIGIRAYDGVANDEASLRSYVQHRHGSDPGFVAGTVSTVEFAERELLAMTFQTGGGFTAANHLEMLWPRASSPVLGAPSGDSGVAIVLTSGGVKPRDARDLLATPALAPVLQSLFVDLEWL